uniref:Putative secreted protein n=1 Tax=Anopheles darlingi TaxID=43151 RepID=A0A2M4DD59_ANODA
MIWARKRLPCPFNHLFLLLSTNRGLSLHSHVCLDAALESMPIIQQAGSPFVCDRTVKRLSSIDGVPVDVTDGANRLQRGI